MSFPALVLNRRLYASLPKYDSTITLWKRFCGTVLHEAQRQSDLFNLERKRQREAIGRIEKIEVNYEGPSENTTVILNKDLSTPYDCALHIGEMVAKRSAVALVNGDTLWHMHKPLIDSCNLQLLHYNIPQPVAVNKAFWRTCSFLLGAVISNAFKDNINVQLHSFPSPNVRSGSFIYDVQLSLDSWTPTQNELRVLSAEMVKFCQQGHKIQCIDVTADFALLVFKNNPHKTKQIPSIAAGNGGKVTLFKAGQHIDISRGPLITNTNHLGRITIAKVYKLDTDILGDPIYRFQGVSLPTSIRLNHFAYGLLEERARNLNSARIPSSQSGIHENSNVIKQAVA